MSENILNTSAQATTQPEVQKTDAPVTTEAAKAEPAKTETQAAKPDAQATETKTEAPEAKPVVPEKYDLKLAKDSPLDAQAVEKISIYAKEKGLSNEQAQALLDQRSDAVTELLSKQTEAMKTKQSAWLSEIQNDKEIGGKAFEQSVELAKRAVDRFGSEAFKKELNETGLGNHPELVRVFAKIGREMAEDKLVNAPSQLTKNKSHAASLYGETKEN